MAIKLRSKTIETIAISVDVRQRDINEGKCGLKAHCMHKVAIERTLRNIDPKGGDHRVRVDNGHVIFNLRGHHWRGDLPKRAGQNLLQFDHERNARAKAERNGVEFVSKVVPHSYRLEMERRGAIKPLTRERQEQINEARRKRIAAGKPDKKKYDLRYRVEGLGNV